MTPFPVIPLLLYLIGGKSALVLAPTVTALEAARSPAQVEAVIVAMSPAARDEAIRLIIDKAPDIVRDVRKYTPVVRALIRREIVRRRNGLPITGVSTGSEPPTGPPLGFGGVFTGWR